MRHRKKINRLSRPRGHRNSLMRNLAASFVLSGKLKTTKAKAKELSKFIEKLFTTSRRQSEVNKIRLLKKVFFTEECGRKFLELDKKLSGLQSGFTRIIPLKLRDGDAAEIVQIEFTK